MSYIAVGVDFLNSVGPLLQIVVSPIVGYTVSKIGHRLPFLFGSFVQITSTVMFVFGRREWIYYIAGALEGMGFTFIFVSGLTMITAVFEGEQRTAILSRAFATAASVAALSTFPLGGLLYDLAGVMLPFGIAGALALVDGAVRLILDTRMYDESVTVYISQDAATDNKSSAQCSGEAANAEKTGEKENTTLTNLCEENSGYGTSDKPKQTTDKTPIIQDGDHELDCEDDVKELATDDVRNSSGYLDLLKDSLCLKLFLMVLLYSMILSLPVSTAYNFSLNVLQAEQWQLGLVLTIAIILQVIIAASVGGFLTRENIWIYVLVGNISQFLCLVAYPLCTSVWWTLFPECFIRSVAFFVGLATVPNLYEFMLVERHKGCHAKIFSMLNVSFTLGFTIGPQLGNLLEVISFMYLFYIVAGVIVIPVTFFGLHVFCRTGPNRCPCP
jgi:MFS family permease